MFVSPRFDGPNAQNDFNDYCLPTLQALVNGQYVKIETANNHSTLVVTEKPTFWQRLVRFLCPRLFISENQKFENIAPFILNLLEANEKLLQGQGKTLLQLQGRWTKRDATIGGRLQAIATRVLEGDILATRQLAQQDRQLAQQELKEARERKAQAERESQRVMQSATYNADREQERLDRAKETRVQIEAEAERKAKEIIKTAENAAAEITIAKNRPPMLDIAFQMPSDCVILCKDGKQVFANSRFLLRVEYFERYFNSTFKRDTLLIAETDRKERDASNNVNCETEEKFSHETEGLNGGLDVVVQSKKEIVSIDLRGDELNLGFSEKTVHSLLYYLYSEQMDPSCTTLQEVSELFILADRLGMEKLILLCMESIRISYHKWDRIEELILNSPFNHQGLIDCLVHVDNTFPRDKLHTDEYKEFIEKSYEQQKSCTQSSESVTCKTKSDQLLDRFSIYGTAIAKLKEDRSALLQIGSKRNYGPAIVEYCATLPDDSPKEVLKNAFELLKEAMKSTLAGDPRALYWKGYYLNHGFSGKEDEIEALNCYEQAAVEGNVMACTVLYKAYKNPRYLEMGVKLGSLFATITKAKMIKQTNPREALALAREVNKSRYANATELAESAALIAELEPR